MQARAHFLLVVSFVLLLAGCAQAPTVGPKVAPSRLEAVEGSNFKRVVLTEKAAERLDIQTVAVRIETVTRERRVGGEVVQLPAQQGTALPVKAQAGDLGRVWVRVTLSESELHELDRRRSARVTPLGDQDEDEDDEDGVEAEIDDDANSLDDGEDAEERSESASIYYAVNGQDARLAPGQPVLVKLALTGGGERRVVPFAALIYGVHGETWVYTSPSPLTYLRAAVTVDFVEDDQAYLTEGPEAGVQVVTVGGSLLYGAETGVSK